MNPRVLVLGLIWLALTAFTVQVVQEHGLAGGFAAATQNSASIQVVIDLCISLVLIAIWVYGDARAKGLAAPLYVVLILTLGSIGTLIYLIRREFVPSTA